MPTRIAIRGDGSQQKDDARLTRLRVRLRREPMFGVGGRDADERWDSLLSMPRISSNV
jgi:hypothetical protein